MQKLYNWLAREDGQTMAEYGVVLAVITIAVFGALALLSGNTSAAPQAISESGSLLRGMASSPRMDDPLSIHSSTRQFAPIRPGGLLRCRSSIACLRRTKLRQ